MTPTDYKQLEADIIGAVDRFAAELIETSRDIHAHPEQKFEEHYAHALLTRKLDEHGFEVQRGVGGLPTAFAARTGDGNGPTIAIIAEYDALPNGHSCGHNLIATSALGAGFALNAVMDRLPGQVAVIGTPAEEGGNGKGILRDAGVFKGIDCAMMTHMAMENVTRPVFLAVRGAEITFHGKPAHAAAAPEAGINALDAVIQTFNGINAMRQHVRSDARIHGIITNGGQAANIVPELAACRFAVRARDMAYASELLNKLRGCAEGAALSTGAALDFKAYGGVEHVENNSIMAGIYGEKMRMFGRPPAETQKDGPASTDMGGLSHYLPAIHPLMQIADLPTAWHTDAFREASISDRGHEGMIAAAKCMALTALDLLVKPGALQSVKDEFKRVVG
jgi:amidohydrolase